MPACGLLVLALAFHAANARAEPVLTLLIGAESDGSRAFSEDLVQLWAARNGPTPERLAVRIERDPRRRLAELSRRRGDLTLLPADEAARLMPDYPRVRALAVLWPLYLHALTRNEAVQSVRLPLAAPAWVVESAAYAYDGIWEWSPESSPAPERLELFPAEWTPDVLIQLRREVFLFSAPAPMREVGEELTRDPTLRLVPFDAALLEQFRANYPWLRTGLLPQGTYPGMRAGLELPARHMVMLGHIELSPGSVAKVLDTTYGAREAAGRLNPLFRQIRPESNASFARLLNFHPAAVQALGFAPKQP